MSRLNVANFRHPDGTVDNINLDSSGRVLIGTTTVGNANADELTLENGSGAAGVTIRAAANYNSNVYFADPGSATIGRVEYRHNGDTMRFYTFGSEVMRNTSTGELMFNSGYGSVATAYGVRAWVTFRDSSGTPVIAEDGNVSTIGDNGTGDYTINFSNAMPDTDYCMVGTLGSDGASHGGSALGGYLIKAMNTGSVRVLAGYGNSMTSNDWQHNCIAVFR